MIHTLIHQFGVFAWKSERQMKGDDESDTKAETGVKR